MELAILELKHAAQDLSNLLRSNRELPESSLRPVLSRIRFAIGVFTNNHDTVRIED